ncbi:MAG: M23 family metallopeptidase, partial [Bdellovibrionales bacterium]|nr:M23 family metallopeptidase [Bdellovibrionales bacterium]
MKRIFFILILLIIVAGITAYFSPKLVGVAHWADRNGPSLNVSIDERESGRHLVLHGEDTLNLVSSISILATPEGSDAPTILLEREFSPPIELYEDLIPLKTLVKPLREGKITLEARISDNSYWKNVTQQSIAVEIDKTIPSLEVLSQQHKMYAGGAEFVLYRTSDTHLARSGITLGGNTFFGQPVKEVFPSTSLDSDVYAVVCAAPLGLPTSDFHPTLWSQDTFGNENTIPLFFAFVEREPDEGKPEISERFLTTKIPPLVNEASNTYSNDFEPFETPESEDGWRATFQSVNETFRAKLRAELESLLRERSTPTFFTAPMSRPMGGKLMSGFGEHRYYQFNGQGAGQSVHEGFDIASVKNDVVVAAAPGTVVFSKQFGIYGNAVLIDHGLGVSTLYGHLSSLSVKEGDHVEQGQKIAVSGESGLAGGDHLHFEIRVGFV